MPPAPKPSKPRPTSSSPPAPPAVPAQLAELQLEVRKLRAENDRLRARVARPKARRIPTAYEKLGAPPTDPLEATEWVHKLLVASTYRAARDTSISEAESRAEVARLAAQVKDLIPTTRLAQAQRAVAADNADVLNGAGPELVNAQESAGPGAAGGDRPAARRGRPPKRSLR